MLDSYIILLHKLSNWNGKYKGQDCNPAVYVYWLEVELTNGKKWKLYGDITLLR
ncbi:MAG: hypothetical protein ABI851_11095 [Saprospiraceae bacterium]